jgi:general stress protein YciG
MAEKGSKGGMTVEEAGRLGGKKVVQQYGPGHMASIGKKGGEASPTKFQSGDQRTAAIASKGGHASGGNFAHDPKRAAEAGRKGGEARSRVRRMQKEQAAHAAEAGETHPAEGAAAEKDEAPLNQP